MDIISNSGGSGAQALIQHFRQNSSRWQQSGTQQQPAKVEKEVASGSSGDTVQNLADNPPRSTITEVITPPRKFQPYKLKLENYDGSQILEEYLVHFQVTADALEWTHRERGFVLANALRGKALTVLCSLLPKERCDLDRIIAALRMHFGRDHLKHLAHVQLYRRRQKPEETFESFAAEIRRLVNAAFPDIQIKDRERIAIYQFLDGISDPEIQNCVRMEHPNSLNEALIIAMECE